MADKTSSSAPDDATDRPDDADTKRRSRSRTKVIDLTGSASGTNGSSDAADAKAPAKRRTRKKKEDAPAPTEDAQADGGSEAPKRRRRKTRDAEPVASSDSLPDEGGSDDEGGGRRKKRSRSKKGGDSPKKGGDNSKGGGHPGEPFEGMLELIGDKKFGFIRELSTSLTKGDNDPFMPPPLIQKYNLRDGVLLKGTIKPGRKGAWQVSEVEEVMGMSPDEWAEETEDFDEGLVIYPEEKLHLVTGSDDTSMRVIDMVSPLGKGQRALIVAPPRAGKTVLLKGIAAGLAENHPEVKLVALLIDERPEEVTDFRRNTECTVFASSNDAGEDNHVRVATLAFEYARRLVEQKNDVVILLDSLTRLGRTFNLFGGNSGRTMSGGLDARALLMPRKIFGSARNIENGGSLTIIATALVETGSRMDDVIFEEFKGTGNAEIVLDRDLSEKRIYPAINIKRSGTRNEERLVPDEIAKQRNMLLRALNSRYPDEAMQALLKQIQLSPSNEHLLNELIPE
ncbi:transcription termination factor Rho [Rubrivirga sp. S365]|uniref:Transcription termination factor Rho n=1 Tax=Rubrivirga litoralis TaxID=3075598 RepID=A0ABU3BP19_9BACT|nr:MULTISPECIES: transcription termination factor Rho [unclassified Rubrivirga]MDT0631033.1 transcription termination factor Rho [Rubrivirga sp. F394]MDT7855059.1 transcription termination factor Rho [Rubrivirga sp. S365]